MRVLDLFSGLGGWHAAFTDRGHHVTTLDLEERFQPGIRANILDVTPEDLPDVDVILASPPCEAFSVASMGHHWTGGYRAYEPATEHAKTSKLIVKKTLELIKAKQPDYWWLENPRGVLRKLPIMRGIPRVTVTYCQYGEDRMKPTDLWGQWPMSWTPRPMCSNGDPCHEAAPAGSNTGTQGLNSAAERAVVPYELSLDVCLACENPDQQPTGQTRLPVRD